MDKILPMVAIVVGLFLLYLGAEMTPDSIVFIMVK